MSEIINSPSFLKKIMQKVQVVTYNINNSMTMKSFR